MFVVNQNLTNPKNGRSLLASLLLLLPLQSYDPAFRKVDGTRSNKKTHVRCCILCSELEL